MSVLFSAVKAKFQKRINANPLFLESQMLIGFTNITTMTTNNG